MTNYTLPRKWRRCAECHEEQLLANFPTSKKAKTGYGGTCRSCLGLPDADTEARLLAESATRAARMCDTKHRYSTWDHAAAIALRCSTRRGTALRVYDCPLCGAFHLTKTTAKELVA